MERDVDEPRAVATVMLKGGMTKSVITANTAEALGRAGARVCAVDLDPNGHLTVGLGYEDVYHDPEVDLGDVILSDGDADPSEAIVETGFGFDLLPATETLERVGTNLTDEMQPSLRLKQELVDPLLGERYDYFLVDTHSSRNPLTNNAVVAAPNLLVPLIPESGTMRGLSRTRERIIDPLRDRIGLDVLALVPNRMSQRIDYQTSDRELLERICRSDALSQYVPNFGYVTPETFDAVDDGSHEGPLPKPGIREDRAIDNSFDHGQPLGTYAPENPQLSHFDELADVVMRGEVVRDA